LKKCPTCGGQVSSKAAACPACGHPLKAKKKGLGGCGLIFFGTLAFLVVAMIAAPKRPAGQGGPAPATPAPAPIAPSMPVVSVGDVVTLDDGDTMCALAADDEAWDAMIGIQNAGGDMMPLVRERRVFPAPRGSTAKVIRTGVTSYQLQLLDGPHAGRIGWIQREFAKKP
jgi:hypothetical protein